MSSSNLELQLFEVKNAEKIQLNEEYNLSEYNLREHRSNFRSISDAFFQSVVLKDIKESKTRELKKMEQAKFVLRRSKLLTAKLKSSDDAFNKQSNMFNAEIQRRLKTLQTESRTINEEASESRKELYELISSMTK